MRWYNGGIAEAITTSKTNNAIFVVYLAGKDGQSEKITNLLETAEVGEKLESKHFVAVKIEEGSVAHQQFSEIFQDPSVPSMYFIGRSGIPLDIITGADDLNALSKRIDIILQKGGISDSTSPSQDLIKCEQQSSDRNNVVCQNGTCTIKKKEEETGESLPTKVESSDLVSPEEKLERAKELLQKKKQEREQEEMEKERMKEIERRKLGQNVQQLKNWQEDQERKQVKLEREREKRENQQARERILAQIAQDKAERISKSQQQSGVPETSKPSISQSSPRSNSTIARLQFRLPNGSSITEDFTNSDSLEIVIAYIKANLDLPFSDFKLSTTFPRREFTINDHPQTLMDLQLTPNAVILILPINNGSVSTQGGGILTNIIWSVFGPFFYIFGILRNFIFGTNPNVTGNKRPSNDASQRAERAKKKSKNSVIKKQGNVHKLSDRTDSDEDNNTWNGNSTQQM